jgi:hypothetical protein
LKKASQRPVVTGEHVPDRLLVARHPQLTRGAAMINALEFQSTLMGTIGASHSLGRETGIA